ncbi:hypothetical protein GJ631_14970 [Natronomonas sp. CBA1123]|uniref:hypothetical protein n=1 Tax=Natronomonas sp. CBA1123 TaxID=2668070 RepID=UPI0012EA1D3F|nr:hypothetical protein [Natronomonas sp. CBA1123]MUV87817.1 hypothetical protein [Natronomonas sp. CBA1123]
MNNIPTFQNNKDRLTFLLAEFRLPLTVMVIAAVVIVLFFEPSLPDPPEPLLSFTVAAGLIAMPSYAIGYIIANPSPDYVRVLEADAGSDEKAIPHNVPRHIWEEREEDGPPAYQLPDGTFLVREFEYLDDVDSLRVTGIWKVTATPMECWRAEKRVDDMYGWMCDRLQEASTALARIERMGVDIHDSVVRDYVEVDEKAKMPSDGLVTDAIDEAVDDLDVDEEPPAFEASLEPEESRFASDPIGPEPPNSEVNADD